MRNYNCQTLFIYLTLLVHVSCSSQNKRIEEANAEYRRDIEKFGAGFVTHFPKKLYTSDFTTLVSENITESHPKVWLKYSPSQEHIDSLVAKLSIEAKAIYESNDSCLLIIDKHLTEDNWIDYDKASQYLPNLYGNERECTTSKLPVPKFWNEYFVERKASALGLAPGYKLYIVDAQKGKFLSNDSIPNGKLTPSEWEHGFTKGVAINKQSGILIYWFDTW
ncbi:hypothetical protein H7F15_11890 [Pontibacter sp. Tf4]|uniref:hypothetical protein n=1 Tax=Pontibacter sp. Tf4 TaxID=2761620 RepID=UPI001629294B|nr:hypothetical protein [Pontibacter sp. Tf4]MBB6611742.1 hypothetical protein [Pontibacter sp. Tf4]